MRGYLTPLRYYLQCNLLNVASALAVVQMMLTVQRLQEITLNEKACEQRSAAD